MDGVEGFGVIDKYKHSFEVLAASFSFFTNLNMISAKCLFKIFKLLPIFAATVFETLTTKATIITVNLETLNLFFSVYYLVRFNLICDLVKNHFSSPPKIFTFDSG